jgi:SAM-dependent methyltransferase
MLERVVNLFRRKERPYSQQLRSADDVETEVAYAIARAQQNIELAASHSAQPRVLEIGPGPDFGPQILLADTGARVTVADRYLAEWQPRYHSAFYRRLREVWGKPSPALDAVIAAKNPAAAITMLTEPAEDLRSCAGGSIDIVISHAALEHVSDLRVVIAELARITAPGGIGSHQIDFRDHGDFSRPLEFLLLSGHDHIAVFDRHFGSIGNRWRHCDVAAMCRDEGFVITDAAPNLLAEATYMADFLPRLRHGAPSRFSAMSDDELAILGARFLLEKPKPI